MDSTDRSKDSPVVQVVAVSHDRVPWVCVEQPMTLVQHRRKHLSICLSILKGIKLSLSLSLRSESESESVFNVASVSSTSASVSSTSNVRGFPTFMKT